LPLQKNNDSNHAANRTSCTVPHSLLSPAKPTGQAFPSGLVPSLFIKSSGKQRHLENAIFPACGRMIFNQNF
jgi:hypothetical protein